MAINLGLLVGNRDRVKKEKEGWVVPWEWVTQASTIILLLIPPFTIASN